MGTLWFVTNPFFLLHINEVQKMWTLQNYAQKKIKVKKKNTFRCARALAIYVCVCVLLRIRRIYP